LLLGTLTPEELHADRRTYLAVTRCIQIIGEAGWKLPDGFKKTQTSIPWPLIAGMRHKLIHDYGRVDFEIVHRVVRQHLGLMVSQLRAVLISDGPPPA
jgi:uncharacterized protein with HEPN domain